MMPRIVRMLGVNTPAKVPRVPARAPVFFVIAPFMMRRLLPLLIEVVGI
jgi:hypothetical protein